MNMEFTLNQFVTTLGEMFAEYAKNGSRPLCDAMVCPATMPPEGAGAGQERLLRLAVRSGFFARITHIAPEDDPSTGSLNVRFEMMIAYPTGKTIAGLPFAAMTTKEHRFRAACAGLVLWHQKPTRGFPPYATPADYARACENSVRAFVEDATVA